MVSCGSEFAQLDWNVFAHSLSPAAGRRYAMREALEITRGEGLESLWKRHYRVHQRLWAGLKPMGLQPFVQKDEDRLISVNTVLVGPLEEKTWADFAIWGPSIEHARMWPVRI